MMLLNSRCIRVSMMVLAAVLFTTHAMGFTVVQDKEAKALVVVADNAPAVALHAAGELIEHVRLSTGATLQLLKESQLTQAHQRGRIFVGVTEAARKKGLDLKNLPPDGCILKVVNGDLFISGPKDGDDPMRESAYSYSGTMYGVSELLERFVGVRWLWPGELGTYVPQVETLRIDEDIDEVIAPVLEFRRMRSHVITGGARKYDDRLGRLSFSHEALKQYSKDLTLYKRRHRMGDTKRKPVVGHYFHDWWKRHGKTNPEWFAMDRFGRRGPGPRATERQQRHVPMCVSNTDLQQYIVDKAWDGKGVIRLGEVDARVFCLCPECRKLDAPQPAQRPAFAPNLYQPMMASNRYAKFWQMVGDLAVKRTNSPVTITTFLYWNYLPAPTNGVRFGDDVKVYGEWVPAGQDELTYWPISDEAYRWLQQQWLGWRRAGVEMGYRPNYFHGGYVMPHLSTHQAGRFFQWAAQNGMIGFDQDMLIGHWAAKGPMFYMHMRLANNPQMDIRQIRSEYFEAFGPAGDYVEQYFDYWERYSRSRKGDGLYNPVQAGIAYPPESFEAAAMILQQALEAVEGAQQQYIRRVEFLWAGLEHARLAAKFMGLLDMGAIPTQRDKIIEAREALRQLRDFRKLHEKSYIADYLWASRQEHRYVSDIEALLGIEEVRSSQPSGEERHIALENWLFTKDVDDVGLEEKWFNQPAGDNWRAIKVPAFWDHTDVGKYLGYAWYRCSFTIPPQLRNEPLNVHFGGVDEQAWVYLNGHKIGEHTEESQNQSVHVLWETPFTITLPLDLLNPQGANELMIRVHNSNAAGGIWRTVSLYAPDDQY